MSQGVVFVLFFLVLLSSSSYVHDLDIDDNDTIPLSRLRRQIQQEPGLPILNPPIPTSIAHYLGADQSVDSCVRDEVLVEGGCHSLLTRGPCSEGEYVLLDPSDLKGFCAPRLCSPDRIFIFSDQQCHDPRNSLLCPPGRQLYVTAYGTPVCQCPDGTYEGDDDLDDDVCDPILGQTLSCPPGQVLWFRDFRSPPDCLPDPCGGLNLNRGPNDLPFVPSAANGNCYQLGQNPDVCPAETWYSLALETLHGVCESLEEAGYQVFDEQTLAFFSSTYGPPIPRETTAAIPVQTPGTLGAGIGQGFSGQGRGVAPGTPGQIGTTDQGLPGQAGTSRVPGQTTVSGNPGQSSISGQGFTGFSGQTGTSGIPGSASQGFPGFSGIPGQTGANNNRGQPGATVTQGLTGGLGQAETPGFSGQPGTSSISGQSGISTQGFSGFTSTPGQAGAPGIPGQSGISTQGFQGFTSTPGQAGTPNIPGQSGISTQGFPGLTGTPGQSRTPGTTRQPGSSGILEQGGGPGSHVFSGQQGAPGQIFTGHPGSGFTGQPGILGQSNRETPKSTIQVGQSFPVGPPLTNGQSFSGQGFSTGFNEQTIPGQSFPGQSFPGQVFSGPGGFGQASINTTNQVFSSQNPSIINGHTTKTVTGHTTTTITGTTIAGQSGAAPGFKQMATLEPASSHTFGTPGHTTSQGDTSSKLGVQKPGEPRGGSHRGHPAHVISGGQTQLTPSSPSVARLQPIGPPPGFAPGSSFHSPSSHSRPGFMSQASPVLSPRIPTGPPGHIPNTGYFMPGYFMSNEQQSLEMFSGPEIMFGPSYGKSMSSQQSSDLSVVMGDLVAHRTGLSSNNPDLSFLQTSPGHPNHDFFNGVQTLMTGYVENPMYVQPRHLGSNQYTQHQSTAAGQHRRRYRRSPLPYATPGNVFETRLLACRAGAIRDINAKCRNTILPSRAPARRPIRAVPPVPPRPGCPTGQAFDRRRRCVSTSQAVNSINAFNLGK